VVLGRQRVLHGKISYAGDPSAYFEFIYPPLPAILLAIPSWFGKFRFILPVVSQRRAGGDQPAVECDDRLGRIPGALSSRRCPASSRDVRVDMFDRHRTFMLLRDALGILVAAKRPAMGGGNMSRLATALSFPGGPCCFIWCGRVTGRLAASNGGVDGRLSVPRPGA